MMKSTTLKIGFFMCTLVLFGLSLPMTHTVSAKPFRLGKLPDTGKNFGCGTCHVNPRGRGPLNAFGSDYQKIAIPAGDSYISEVKGLDSDGDGFTNDQEFDAKTNPGDPKSK